MEAKKYPTKTPFGDITKGYIVTKNEYQTLLIRTELANIHQNITNFLVIYAIYPRLTRITCYPLQITKLWKLKLQLATPNQEIFAQISHQIERKQMIHTTGLSEKNGKFVVENYLEPKKNWDNAIKLVDYLSRINGILKCQIEEIQ